LIAGGLEALTTTYYGAGSISWEEWIWVSDTPRDPILALLDN
jgi:hypothetical protein